MERHGSGHFARDLPESGRLSGPARAVGMALILRLTSLRAWVRFHWAPVGLACVVREAGEKTMNDVRTHAVTALAITATCVMAALAGVSESGPEGAQPDRFGPATAFRPGPNGPPAPLAAGSVGEGELVGTLYFSEDSNGNGLYVLDQIDGSSTLIGASGVNSTTVGLAPADTLDEVFGSRPSGLLRIATNGEGSSRTGSLLMEGMAYDRLARRIYGTANQSFFRVDPATGNVVAMLPSPGVDIEGLALGVDALGRRGIFGLVGFGGAQTALYFYDLSTGAWSQRGDTKINWSHVGLAFDECNEVLYAKGSQDSMLYRLVLSGFGTVEVEEVGDTGISRGGGLAWVGVCPGPPCTSADVNRDGLIGFADILAILGSFGDCPGGVCTEGGSCDKGYERGCGGDPDCACVELFDGTLVCHSDFGCGEACPDGTCPPGFHCVRDSCCGPTVCAPDEALCGDGGDPCDEDVDGNNRVDFGDLLAVLGQWGPCQLPVGACCVFAPDGGPCVDDVTQDECKAMQGVYQGDGTDCGGVECK